MTGYGYLAVFGGAGFGALLRWVLGSWLNPVWPLMPLGTVAANLLGGLAVGVASAYFAHNTALAPEWRLLVITGFMGGLTTFSICRFGFSHALCDRFNRRNRFDNFFPVQSHTSSRPPK